MTSLIDIYLMQVQSLIAFVYMGTSNQIMSLHLCRTSIKDKLLRLFEMIEVLNIELEEKEVLLQFQKEDFNWKLPDEFLNLHQNG